MLASAVNDTAKNSVVFIGIHRLALPITVT